MLQVNICFSLIRVDGKGAAERTDQTKRRGQKEIYSRRPEAKRRPRWIFNLEDCDNVKEIRDSTTYKSEREVVNKTSDK